MLLTVLAISSVVVVRTITDPVVSQQFKGSRSLSTVLLENTAKELPHILIQLEFLKRHQLADLIVLIVSNLKSNDMQLLCFDDTRQCGGVYSQSLLCLHILRISIHTKVSMTLLGMAETII